MDSRTRAPARLAFSSLVAAAVAAPPAGAQVTGLVSIAADGTQADAICNAGDVSADGRFCVFTSWTRKLVPGTLNIKVHVFVADRDSGAIELAAVDSSGVQANEDALRPRISGDGRFVVFETLASNLAPGDFNGKLDCYLRDRELGITERISVSSSGAGGSGDSFRPVVSDDGRYVLFTSFAQNFAAGDDNDTADVFLRDRELGTTTLVSVALDGGVASSYSESADLTPDGRLALFRSSATDLVAGSNAGWNKMILRDLALGITEQVSLTWDGAFPAGDCIDGRITPDGRFVTFTSPVHTIVPNDSNQRDDIFVRDRLLATTERVNVGSDGAQDDGGASRGRISDDGRFVTFSSASTRFAPSDTNDASDVYLRDRWRGATRQLSISTAGQISARGGGEAEICGDGGVILFSSGGDELDPRDDNGVGDVLVHVRAPGYATSAVYGSGFPGRAGPPTLELADDPVIGEPIALLVGNSAGAWTLGFLLVGTEELALPAGWGGELLVEPLLVLPVPLPPDRYTLLDEVPYDAGFFAVVLRLQVLVLDPAAAEGIASSAGLEVAFGS